MKRPMKTMLAALAMLTSGAVLAQTKEVTIGYQDMLDPYRIAQESKEIEKATGYKINWKQFHTMVAVEQAKGNPADVQILNMRPPEVRAAWQRGDIQATFIWDPVLAEVKKDGKVITSSGKISAETGKATFDGYIVNKDWA